MVTQSPMVNSVIVLGQWIVLEKITIFFFFFGGGGGGGGGVSQNFRFNHHYQVVYLKDASRLYDVYNA